MVNKSSNSNTPLVQQETREERLTKLKALLDQDVLTKEEFEEQKKRILED
ncbi:SHOCT domain-containing protein [Bacteroides acidifaciens]